jgi:O-antigen/teichoic acid export membrane protein
MERFTDLRFIIGLFFSLSGLILLLCYFFAAEGNHPELNLYAGILMLLFGLLMLLLFYRGDAADA